jgi:hypothetical protein
MAQAYSDPSRASDPHALPDVEVWYETETMDLGFQSGEGWYWQACFPGCLPDGDPVGPFETETDALADAQKDNPQEEA